RDVTALASDVGGPCTDLCWRGIGGDALAFWLSRGSLGRWRNSTGKLPDRTQHFQPVPERQLEVFKMLISQVGKNRQINSVFHKTVGVLGHAELCEPVRNLLHCEPPRTEHYPLWTDRTESLPHVPSQSFGFKSHLVSAPLPFDHLGFWRRSTFGNFVPFP